MIDPARLPERSRVALRSQLDSGLEMLRNLRLSFWGHWAQLAEVYLPRRYKWFITPNQWNRGSQINSAIVDETGVLAARTLASGMMAGMTSPTRPWFRLGLHDLATMPFGDARDWLAECERRMMRVLSESNFYESLAVLYHDIGVFGSGNMIIYEDADQVIRCYNPCLGEFFFGNDGSNRVSQNYREFTLTIGQACDMFGLEALEPGDQVAYRQGGGSRLTEIVIAHAIEPNGELWENATAPLGRAVPSVFKWREVYWKKGSTGAHILKMAGFREKPFVGARWDLVSNDAYGRSPGMDGLPVNRQLQIQQRRKAEAIDKLVRPPMNASVNMKNEPMSILPGAVNYVADLQNAGFKPAYQVDPRLQEMTGDIREAQDRLNRVFFVDLFMMISNLDTVRTATEIDARREEKLIQLGPVIERFENEVLDTIIDRVFAIMARRGLFETPPAEIGGADINVQYISMLAEAQRAASTAGIERLFQVVGNLVGVKPDIVDTLDWEKGIEIYADRLAVEPELINSPDEIAALRQARAEAEQQQAMLAAGAEAAKAGKLLSETDVGGGESALQAMLQ